MQYTFSKYNLSWDNDRQAVLFSIDGVESSVTKEYFAYICKRFLEDHGFDVFKCKSESEDK